MSEADANWFTQNSRYTFEHDRNTLIHNAEKRGLEAGIQQGLQQGLQEGLQQGLQKGLQQGVQQGSQQKAIEAAVNLIIMKLGTPEQIAEAQGLALEKVLELQKSVLAKHL